MLAYGLHSFLTRSMVRETKEINDRYVGRLFDFKAQFCKEFCKEFLKRFLFVFSVSICVYEGHTKHHPYKSMSCFGIMSWIPLSRPMWELMNWHLSKLTHT